MKHKRTTKNKKYKSDMLDKDTQHWTYGKSIAREASLRKEYRQLKRSKNWQDEI